MKLMPKPEYEKSIAETRDKRMAWFRDARFGMFIHFGLFSQLGRHEWAQVREGFTPEEYALLANDFKPKENCCREWCALAKKAGMKYAVLTARHHEGFSLWKSDVNPFNIYNFTGRDIVGEFVEACREYDLKVGIYNSLMDWHHPDGGAAAYDTEARLRLTKYVEDLTLELMSNYGKIDLLWYDGLQPINSWEGWDSLTRNQKVRALQPDIIINNRSFLEEDYGTPEENIKEGGRDWESCMTFNKISWGYIDSAQAAVYSYSAQDIVTMLHQCAQGRGNLLLNIGPTPDGSVPPEAVTPLTEVGRWLEANGEAVYGYSEKSPVNLRCIGPGIRYSIKGNTIYLWVRIMPVNREIRLGGFLSSPEKISFLDGTPVEFIHENQRIVIKNLPEEHFDKILNITMLKMEFADTPQYKFASLYPQLCDGMTY